MQAVSGTTRSNPSPAGEWHRRPVLSRVLRVAIFVVPIAVSLGAAILLSIALPRAHDAWTAILWIAVIAGVSLVTLFIFERVARRFLPLAALLNVSLLFPDRAPARFAVARRSGRTRDLNASLQRAQATGDVDEATRLSSVIELVLAMSVHDRATRGHSERVRVFTDMIADELKLSPEARSRLRWAAMLHDIGKLEVSPATLNKREPLSSDEWAVIHQHPLQGARLVAPLLPWLDVWGAAVEQHHERFDGTGYPFRLRGHQISLGARIVSVADCYEVMTAPRAYKPPMSVPAARAELTRAAGAQFDPRIVRAFLNVSVGRLWRTIGVGAWIAQVPTLNRLVSSFGSWSTPGIAAATAVALLAIGGLAATPPAVAAPGGVAGLHASQPSATATIAPPSAPLTTPPPLVATGPSSTPLPRVDNTQYPYLFTMNPLHPTPPRAPRATASGSVQIQMSPLPHP